MFQHLNVVWLLYFIEKRYTLNSLCSADIWKVVSSVQCVHCYRHSASRPLQEERVHLRPPWHTKLQKLCAELVDDCRKFQQRAGFPQEQFLLKEASQKEAAGINMYALVFL